jgi:hypothetical protein
MTPTTPDNNSSSGRTMDKTGNEVAKAVGNNWLLIGSILVLLSGAILFVLLLAKRHSSIPRS